jgi:hypothetical protein
MARLFEEICAKIGPPNNINSLGAGTYNSKIPVLSISRTNGSPARKYVELKVCASIGVYFVLLIFTSRKWRRSKYPMPVKSSATKAISMSESFFCSLRAKEPNRKAFSRRTPLFTTACTNSRARSKASCCVTIDKVVRLRRAQFGFDVCRKPCRWQAIIWVTSVHLKGVHLLQESNLGGQKGQIRLLGKHPKVMATRREISRVVLHPIRF